MPKNVDRRSSFGAWIKSLRASNRELVKEIIVDEYGIGQGSIRKYITGDVDITKNLPPAVKNKIIDVFPDAKEILYPKGTNLVMTA